MDANNRALDDDLDQIVRGGRSVAQRSRHIGRSPRRRLNNHRRKSARCWRVRPKLISPGEQLLRLQAVSTRDLRDNGVRFKALSDNPRLEITRPTASPANTRDHLNPLQVRHLVVDHLVDLMVKTISPHNHQSSVKLSGRYRWERCSAYNPPRCVCCVASSPRRNQIAGISCRSTIAYPFTRASTRGTYTAKALSRCAL
jgi:hypothetical protein